MPLRQSVDHYPLLRLPSASRPECLHASPDHVVCMESARLPDNPLNRGVELSGCLIPVVCSVLGRQ